MYVKTIVVVVTLPTDGPPIEKKIEVDEIAQMHVLRHFNPTDNPDADMSKALCAALIQQMINLRDAPDAKPGTKRAASIAITQLELVQMPVVKANYALV